MPRELTPQEEANRDFNQSQTEVGSPLKTLKGTAIKRYKNLVGKEVAGQVYLHKDYVETLLTSGKYPDRMISIANYEEALEHIGDTPFNCVMLDHKKRVIRFDEAPDFDTAREPIAGSMTYYGITDRAVFRTDYSGQIWHHKWMWVMNDYTGFDVRESWEWSKEYLSVLRDTGDPQANRGIANGMGQGGKLWRDQLRYFGLEESTDMNESITKSHLDSILSDLKDEIRELTREDPDIANRLDQEIIEGYIYFIKKLYDQYNVGEIDHEELERQSIETAEEIVEAYHQESDIRTKSYLERVLQTMADDLIDIDITISDDLYNMTMKEAEEHMGDRAFDQALELMDKFDDVLYDYDEGVKDKDTVAYKFNSLKYKVEQLKKQCGVEDCTFLNEKMKQFEEILQYYSISLEECNESKKISEARDSVTVKGKTYPVKDKSYLNGKLAGYGNDTGLEKLMTVSYKNGDKYEIYDSGIGNMGSSYACAVKIEECNESKKITESSQSPMIFKAGNVYKLTPTESYPYDRVEILGIAWNDMVGQCTIQYKVVMRDGSVEEGQSEAGDLINTIKKNNEDRVEFYRTEVPKMNESERKDEAGGRYDYKSVLAAEIELAITDCINYGSGSAVQGELVVRADWAENEEDIEVSVESNGRRITYTELGVATALGYN